MPNWKKMAEAFGELAGRNMRRGKNSNVDTWSRNSANKSADTQNTYKAGESFGSDLQRIADDLAAASERGETRYNQTSDQFYDQLKEVNQSNRGPGQSLEKDFEDAFEEAVARRKEDRLNEWDWDGKPENQISDADAWDYRAAQDRDDAAEQQVRDELIKELKSGIPLSDFFEKYR